MINIKGKSLHEKAWIVAREIIKNSHTPLIQRLASQLKDPETAFKWVKSHIRYQKEDGDVLYEPEELIERGFGDCEDLTLLIGSIAYAQGYPVRIRLVKNATRHIYPLVKISGKWKVLDAVPSRIPFIGGVPKGYRIVVDGIVKEEGLSGAESPFKKAVFWGAGIAVGATFAKSFMKKLGIGPLSGLPFERVEVPFSYVPKEGDHLLYYFKPKWYIPSVLEKWIVKQIVKRKLKNASIERVYFQKNKEKYLIVEVRVGSESLGALALTAVAIGLAILAGGLMMYFTLVKIEKIVEKPQVSFIMKALPVALGLYAVAKIIGDR